MVTQDHAQVAFEDLKKWRIHNLCRQAVQEMNLSPSWPKLFPDVQRESPLFLLLPIGSGLITGHHWRKPVSVFFTSSLQVFVYIDIFPKPSLLQDEQCICLRLSSQMRCSWPLITFAALHCSVSGMSMSCVTYGLYEKSSRFLVRIHI